ncbi:MAG: phenylalanine--tRNA ligase subunit beta [Alphaproteobacteria bacterium]|nr:phenylalanine--tRNA ligase subunit beta [Alphaproteobacteria bacterium]
MKWTYDWLKDYLKTDLSATEIADLLTRTGLEVDDVITPISPIAARIEKCDAHENSDHLHVLQVNDGSDKLRQVVCGAPNARVGLMSALAVPGCVIDGHEINSGKLRGVLSDGMMCSARELGIGDDHSGIIELPDDTKIGSPVLNTQTVFEAGITPNRPDYLAVRGIARDLAACGAGEYIAPNDTEIAPVTTTRQAIVKTDKCPIYRFAEICDITVAQSTDKIKSRLTAIGINPKNAPIDATNYICYDMAQPMHCFDADQIHGNITIRMATGGEQFTDLFGNAHELKDTDIVIADDMGILALAGVIGGARGATTENTKNIILESAYFDPVSVRKTSKRLGLSTDASYRYERGIDPTITGTALAKCADIIMSSCGGKICGTGVAGNGVAPREAIKYTPDLFLKKTGVDMDADTQYQILSNLGYDVKRDGDAWHITPRPARVDMEIPENVVAELLRIYGYDNIAKNASHRTAEPAAHCDYFGTLKNELASRGLNEVKTFGFANSAIESALTTNPIVKIANPITVELDAARPTLLGNMLQVVADNEKRGYPDLCLFEVGTVFTGSTPGDQHTSVCIVRTGNTSPKHWASRARTYDIYDVKADLISLMHGQKFTVDTSNPPLWAHPYRYGKIVQGKKIIAEFGELHPMIAKQNRIKTTVNVAIVENTDNLPGPRRVRHDALSDFQPITRDFAFIVDGGAPAAALVAAARTADARISDVVVFDAFDMNDGNKSIAFTITITPHENMSDSDIMAVQNAVIANVEKKCNAKIRDK